MGEDQHSYLPLVTCCSYALSRAKLFHVRLPVDIISKVVLHSPIARLRVVVVRVCGKATLPRDLQVLFDLQK